MVSPLRAESPSAADLAAKLSAVLEDNSSTARLKMDLESAAGKTTLQLKVESLRTAAAIDVRYLVLWPKERKGESFVLHKNSRQAAKGSVFTPPDSLKPISQMQDGIFGSDLAYEDLVDNYFAWSSQNIVGEETINRSGCQILESKPGPGDRTGYSRVKTWIDPKKMVPLKVEKYGSNGQLVRTITITLVTKDDLGRFIPVNLRVERPGGKTVTVLEGSNIRHDLPLTDATFSPEGLRSGTKPK